MSDEDILVGKNDQFLAKNLQDLICDFSTINRYHVVSSYRISPDDLCPTGVEAAAADTLRLDDAVYRQNCKLYRLGSA